ncbi:hypothetical protein QVD17_14691 [Tagetes erecta]|uniref:Uncharacterized protein n=1 Tax=Tagetes erecta TaxID=13708 RepID=A0AAD8KNH4_TARER|nr:hypothetical protein QVD17_14691 [Tagetes erecta]
MFITAPPVASASLALALQAAVEGACVTILAVDNLLVALPKMKINRSDRKPVSIVFMSSQAGQYFIYVATFSVRFMPKVKTNRVKYPEGWELVEPTLNELQAKMREAENDPHDGKRKCEALWPIFKIAHQKSRYIFDLYHRRKEISAELYEFCLDQGYADRNIIAKWKKVVVQKCLGMKDFAV